MKVKELLKTYDLTGYKSLRTVDLSEPILDLDEIKGKEMSVVFAKEDRIQLIQSGVDLNLQQVLHLVGDYKQIIPEDKAKPSQLISGDELIEKINQMTAENKIGLGSNTASRVELVIVKQDEAINEEDNQEAAQKDSDKEETATPKEEQVNNQSNNHTNNHNRRNDRNRNQGGGNR